MEGTKSTNNSKPSPAYAHPKVAGKSPRQGPLIDTSPAPENDVVMEEDLESPDIYSASPPQGRSQFAGKGPRNSPLDSASSNADTGSSGADNEEDDEADWDDENTAVFTYAESSDDEPHVVGRADSKVADGEYTPPRNERRSGRASKSSKTLSESELSHMEQKREHMEQKRGRRGEKRARIKLEKAKVNIPSIIVQGPVVPMDEIPNLDTIQIVSKPLQLRSRMFLVQSGSHDCSTFRFGDNPNICDMEDADSSLEVANITAFKRLEGIMSKPEWGGDYTVWMSPLDGFKRGQGPIFRYGKMESASSALLQVQKIDPFRVDYSSMVYMTSRDGKMRWFVKVTPLQTKFCPDQNEG